MPGGTETRKVKGLPAGTDIPIPAGRLPTREACGHDTTKMRKVQRVCKGEELPVGNSGYVQYQVKLPPDDLDFCKNQEGGTSAFVRRLVEADRTDPSTDYQPDKRSTAVNRGFISTSVNMTPAQSDHCAAKPLGRSPYIRHLVSRFRQSGEGSI